jgi:hypothetical protein
MFLDSQPSVALPKAATKEKRTTNPQAIHVMSNKSAANTVEPATPRTEFIPNTAATFVPRDDSGVQALAARMSSTYIGNRKKRPAMAASRKLMSNLLIEVSSLMTMRLGLSLL